MNKGTLRRGQLRPIELASSAVLGGVAVAFVAAGALLPRAGAMELLASVPLAIVAQRHRGRAVLAAALAGAIVAFLVAGTGAALAVIACSVMGAVVGGVSRRGRGGWTVFALSFIIGPLSALALDLLLLVFSAARELAFGAAKSTAAGLAAAMRSVPAARELADLIDNLVNAALGSWGLWVFIAVVAGMPLAMLSVWWVLSAVLERLRWVTVEDALDGGTASGAQQLPPGGPLPVELRDVHFGYPGAGVEALRGVNLRLEGRQFAVVVGANGSGKSTLIRILAGGAVTSGTVERTGGVGLGQIGGTALVMQRPETQVLGMKVSDDLIWGLPEGFEADPDAALEAVGLAGLAERSTASLSGGQLQRLAVATALMRRPSLLISDESTAMVDAEGRESLLDLLAGLPRRFQMTVLHVTHSAPEAARADRVIRMSEGRIIADEPGRQIDSPEPELRTTVRAATDPPVSKRPAPGRDSLHAIGTTEPLLRLRAVEHTYGYGTPWAHQALKRVDLDLYPGEGLLVTGGNGSGKSTLAWVLAGLTRPTGGDCELDGRATADQVGSVALAFQHSRLQLQRPTVAEDILAAAGRRGSPAGKPDSAAGRRRCTSPEDLSFVLESLAAVGLTEELSGRNIDALSGGQMRRVVLAGLLA
ncbi:MAG TPA: ATP-binding cassette domain-containing protein, partial [Micrococcaceae bacterium]